MENYSIHVHSEEETFRLAKKLSDYVQAGDVIALEGDLGAGKTFITKGLAEGLDVKRTVNSPTFTIIKEYQGRLPLYHMDVYRLKDSDEDLGFDEYFHGDGVTIIEWAHIIADYLPDNLLKIEITRTGETSREINFYPVGNRYHQLCKEFFDEYFSN